MGTECEQRSHPITDPFYSYNECPGRLLKQLEHLALEERSSASKRGGVSPFRASPPNNLGQRGGRWSARPRFMDWCGSEAHSEDANGNVVSSVQTQDAIAKSTRSSPRHVVIRDGLGSFLKDFPPSHSEWKDLTTRMNSFTHAPGILKKKDNIRTSFSCGGCHDDWTDADDPFVEHSRWCDKCDFIGGDYIAKYIRRPHEKHLHKLAERGRQEAEESHVALVEELFDGEDIQFYEAAGIRVEALHLAASLLEQRTQRSRVTKDDIVQELSKLCQLKLDNNRRSIPRNKKASSPILIDLRKEHVHECNALEHRPSPGPSFGSIGVLRGIPKYPHLEIPHAVVETGTGSTPSQVGVRSDLDSFLKEYPSRHCKLSTSIARFKSFANAQGISKGKSGTLALNGLYYTGDIISCFHCGGSHGVWRDGDDPVVEHSRWFPKCPFMRFHVGDDVVNYIVSEHQNHMKELTERGRREAKVADKAIVEDLFDGEDIRFYEIVGITLEVLYLAASSLKHGATKDDLDDSIDKLCSLKLETDWREIPRNVQGSYPPLRDVFVRDWNPKQDHLDQVNYRDQALGGWEAGSVSSPSIFEPSRRSKYPEYADYNERFGTFEGFPFPSMAHFCRDDLAGAGLVYTKIRDETMCFHCGQKLSHWEATDNPYREHQRWHPSCEYIQWKLGERLTASSSSDHAMNTSEPMEEAPQEGDDRDSGISSMSAGTSTERTGSVTTDAASEMRPVPAYRSEDVCGNHNPYLAHREPYGNRVNQYSVPHSKPIYQRYASLASRESSFQSYPPNAKGNKEKMAKAGFFYTGTEDRTTCFQCGNSLSNWSNDDDPLYEHARWYPDCPYVVLQLGDEAIENIRRAHSNTLAERMLEERNKSDGKTEFMLENLKSSYLVRRLISQDINRDIVELAIRARLNRTGLVDVLDEQDLRRALGEVVSLPDNVRTREVPKAQGDLSKCINCKTGDRHIIFLPCSHLVSCSGCAASCTVCPSCDRKIATTREVFLA